MTDSTTEAVGTRTLAPGEHHTAVDGLGIAYHVAGSGPVCLVHPGGPGIGWEYLRMPALEGRLTLVYVEPIGTGSSGRLADPRGYTLDRYVHALRSLVEHLGQPKVHLLGHSHGGFVALRYALANPERLAGLILYDTAPTTGPDFMADVGANVECFAEQHAGQPWLPDVLAALEEEANIASDEQATAVIRRQAPFYFRDYWAREQEFGPMRAEVRAFAGPLQGQEPAPYDVRGELGRIGVPTLVIVGRHDPVCSPRWAHALHEGVPASRLVVLEQSAHFGHLEEPETFTSTVADFVR